MKIINHKEPPITVKHLLFISLSSLMLLTACSGDPSKEEQKQRIKDSIKAAVADSIAKVNAQQEFERKKETSEAKVREYQAFSPGFYYAIGRCNLRAYPSTSAPVVGEIYDGEAVYAVAKNGDWYTIQIDEWDSPVYTHKQNLRK